MFLSAIVSGFWCSTRVGVKVLLCIIKENTLHDINVCMCFAAHGKGKRHTRDVVLSVQDSLRRRAGQVQGCPFYGTGRSLLGELGRQNPTSILSKGFVSFRRVWAIQIVQHITLVAKGRDQATMMRSWEGCQQRSIRRNSASLSCLRGCSFPSEGYMTSIEITIINRGITRQL